MCALDCTLASSSASLSDTARTWPALKPENVSVEVTTYFVVLSPPEPLSLPFSSVLVQLVKCLVIGAVVEMIRGI